MSENNEELIAEARDATACMCVDAPEIECGTHGDDHSKLVAALADALFDALATRVPVQGEPNDDWNALNAALNSVHLSDWEDTQALCVKSLADAVVDAGFSRATVPDAATEERIDRWMLLVGKGVEKQMALRAERDAALAAIERLRAIHEKSLFDGGECLECDLPWPCSTVAALDGAPEPDGIARAVVEAIGGEG